jgi:hypothetical protein
MNDDHDWTPLDPDEGPTIWAKEQESNRFTMKVAVGVDPQDPMSMIHLSVNEIENLYEMIQE